MPGTWNGDEFGMRIGLDVMPEVNRLDVLGRFEPGWRIQFRIRLARARSKSFWLYYRPWSNEGSEAKQKKQKISRQKATDSERCARAKSIPGHDVPPIREMTRKARQKTEWRCKMTFCVRNTPR